MSYKKKKKQTISESPRGRRSRWPQKNQNTGAQKLCECQLHTLTGPDFGVFPFWRAGNLALFPSDKANRERDVGCACAVVKNLKLRSTFVIIIVAVSLQFDFSGRVRELWRAIARAFAPIGPHAPPSGGRCAKHDSRLSGCVRLAECYTKPIMASLCVCVFVLVSDGVAVQGLAGCCYQLFCVVKLCFTPHLLPSPDLLATWVDRVEKRLNDLYGVLLSPVYLSLFHSV